MTEDPPEIRFAKWFANKLKELWQYAVFRWCVYQTTLLVFGLLLKGGAFAFRWSSYYGKWIKEDNAYAIYNWELGDYATLIWFLISLLPLWVWRKPIWNFVKGPVWDQLMKAWDQLKKAIGFLNKKAEEG